MMPITLDRILKTVDKLLTSEEPLPGQTLGIAVQSPKVGALAFDRVWGVDPDTPSDLRFFGGTEPERYFAAAAFAGAVWKDTGEFEYRKLVDEAARKVSHFLNALGVTEPSEMPDWLSRADPAARLHLIASYNPPVEESVSWGSRSFSNFFRQRFRWHTVPAYTRTDDLSAEFKPGDYSVVQMALSQLPIPNEDELKWQQVEEFRRDKTARRSYRRMVHWLDGSMVGKPKAWVVEEMSQRLEDYEFALRKHGVATSIGVVKSLLDKDALIGAGVTLTSLVVGGIPLEVGLVAGSLVLAGKALLSFGESRLTLSELETEFQHVAYVHHAKGKLVDS